MTGARSAVTGTVCRDIRVCTCRSPTDTWLDTQNAHPGRIRGWSGLWLLGLSVGLDGRRSKLPQSLPVRLKNCFLQHLVPSDTMADAFMSTSHLVSACVDLSTALNIIRKAPAEVRHLKRELDGLLQLASRIDQSPLFQTPEVKREIESLRSTISGIELDSLLTQSRLRMGVGYVRRGSEIIKAVSAIERGKLSLSLAMQSAQPRANEAITSLRPTSTVPSIEAEEKRVVSDGQELSQWSNSTAADVNQINGVACYAQHARKGQLPRSFKPMRFHGARKTGRGDQVNGLYMEVGSGWEGELPELPGIFENMRFDGNGDGTSTQPTVW